MTETRKHFHDELAEVKSDVLRLGGLASEAIEAGTAAFLDADLAAVERVIAGDRAMDDLMHSIESRTYLLLARSSRWRSTCGCSSRSCASCTSSNAPAT